MSTKLKHNTSDIEGLVAELDFSASAGDYAEMLQKMMKLEHEMIVAGWSYDERLEWYWEHIDYVYCGEWTSGLKVLINNALEGKKEAELIKVEMRKLTGRRRKSFSGKLQVDAKGGAKGAEEPKFEAMRMYLNDEKSMQMIKSLPILVDKLVLVGAIGIADRDALVAFLGGDVARKIERPIQWLLAAKYLNYLLMTLYDHGIWQAGITRTEMFRRASVCFKVKGCEVSADSLRTNRDVKGDAETMFGSFEC